jgi:hypothetical protein
MSISVTQGTKKYKRNKPVATRDAEGKRVKLTDLPLVAYSLFCGHTGRDYAINKGDLLFCTPCAGNKRVAKILAK